tara:strand:- start:138 stop:500 length:363 start_codon:yes stop_codon:yes gene_type:complete
MIDKIKTIFSIPELRDKIFFTFSILIVVRIGAHIPIPGVDANALAGAFDRLQDTLFGLFNMFVGGAFEKASLFSLGIMPYISSRKSIAFFFRNNALYIIIYNYTAHGICFTLFPKTTKRR